MRAVLVALAVLLSGCTLLETGPQQARAACVADLRLVADPPVVDDNTSTTLTLTLRNCGTTGLPLGDGGPCGGGDSLRIFLRGPGGELVLDNRTPLGLPETRAGTYHCPAVMVGATRPQLAPGENATLSFAWTGAVRVDVRHDEPRPFGNVTSFFGRTTLALPGTYALTGYYRALTANATVTVRGFASPPAPAHESAWRAMPAPATPSALGTEEAFTLLDAVPYANESLQRRLVGLASVTFVDSRNGTVDGRWGHHVATLVDAALRFPGAPAAINVTLPVLPGGWVDEDGITGVPDCASAPQECFVNVTREDAIRIAGAGPDANATPGWFGAMATDASPLTPTSFGTLAWLVGPQPVVVDANDGTLLAVGHGPVIAK